MAALALATICACHPDMNAMKLSSPPIKGVVVEAGTGTPIPGAVVVVRWIGYYSALDGGGELCPGAMAVKADSEGRFEIPAWSRKYRSLQNLQIRASPYSKGHLDNEVRFGAKPREVLGFWSLDEIDLPARDLRLEMKPSPEDSRRRADYLGQFLHLNDCAEAGVQGLRPLYLEVRNEVMELPPAIRDFKERPENYSLLEQIDKGYLERTK
jgi:hypothetical protein